MRTPSSSHGIVLVGHGSRDPEGIAEFSALVKLLKQHADNTPVHHGFLEFASPTIEEAVNAAIAEGARSITVTLGILLAATHAKNDIPVQFQQLRAKHPAIEFRFSSVMALHPKLMALARQRLIEAEASSTHTISRADTCLVIVGRGTSDPDANAEIAKLTRWLEEGMGFGASYVCYSGTAQPLVADGLKAAVRLGKKRLLVMPYFLFDGVLVKRIRAATAAIAARCPALDIVYADHLGADPAVVEALLERTQEGRNGTAFMNCATCQYRHPLVGVEARVGQPQRRHHDLSIDLISANRSEPPLWLPYEPHPIEAQSMRIIDAGRDWSNFPPDQQRILKRLVHTSGDFSIPEDMFFSAGAVDIGMRALLRCRRVVTDVTMVQSGMKRALLEQMQVETWCGVHDEETVLMAKAHGLTRSAAGIRRAFDKFGNDVIVSIGDAPTAIMELIRLVREQGWRPQLVIGLPVGFVGTQESKEALRRLMQVPRITNRGTRGGSPWAASVINALMIAAIDFLSSQNG